MKGWRFVGLAFATLFFFGACSADQAGIDVAQLWSNDEVKATGKLVESMGGMTLTREVTLMMKPPFYDKQMPLVYKTISKDMGGGIGSMGMGSIVLCHEFNGWRNIFIYQDIKSMLFNMPEGAVAVETRNNSIIAECKVMKMLDKDKHLTGFELSEIHYNLEGKPIFASTFEVNSQTGFKTKELKTQGKKEKEYFFLWPGGISGSF